MSIFFISLMSGSPWGGSEELWYASALRAAHKGHKVAIAVYHWPEKEMRMKELADAGCEIHYLPNKGRKKKGIPDLVQNKITKWFRIKKAINALPVELYDLVVINQGYFEVTTNTWKSFNSRLKNYILLFHNYSENEKIKPDKALILHTWIRNASLNLFASSRIRAILEDRLNISITNGDILLNPVSFIPPEKPTPFPPLHNGNYRFVVLAALDVDRKAQDQLIRALSASIWKERNWTLHLYGDGKDEKKLRRLIERAGLKEKVFLEGHVTGVEKILKEAHLLLQVSRIDAMPLSVVEALALSRPVVASKIGDMPQWVLFNENGWICHSADATEIERILHLVWANRSSWHKMGERSYEIFRKKYPPSPENYFLEQIGY